MAHVEWRHIYALATAWEIRAREEHLKYLRMLVEDQPEKYVHFRTFGHFDSKARSSSRMI